MKYQVMRDLTPIEYEALKADIAQRGVLVPIEVDENGEILDGHHRRRAWEELQADDAGLADYPVIVRYGLTEEQKRNHARSLNVLRRHLTKEERDDLMRQMRADGMTYQQIADAVGVSVGKVHSAASGVELFNSEKLPGADGKFRPTSYAPRVEPELETPRLMEILVQEAQNQISRAFEDVGPKQGGNQFDHAEIVQAVEVASAKLPIEYRLPDSIVIHNADSRDIDLLDIDPVHLVITSPPYNVGIDYGEHDDNMDNEDYLALVAEVFARCHSLMVDGGRIAVVVPFGVGRNPWVPFAPRIMDILDDCGYTLRGQIVWDKGTTGNRTSWGSFRLPTNPSLRDTTEAIIVAHKGDEGRLALPDGIALSDDKGTYTAALADSDYFMELAQDHWVVAPESATRIGHPAPFPVALAKRLIDFYAFPGAHILDPFGGSGTVGVAALQCGCNATLVEIDSQYCRLAKERVSR